MITSDASPDRQIRQLIRTTGMPLTMFGEAVGWKSSQVLNWWAARQNPLDDKNINSLSQFLGINPDSLLLGTYPQSLVRDRIFIGPQVLPERYSDHASSFVRSSAHIIEYLSLRYGRHFTDKVLLGLNIHPLLFENLDNRINILFFIDLLNQLKHHGLTTQDISSLACFIFLRVQNTDIGVRFSKAATYQESYEVLAGAMPRFEVNFDYDFEIDRKRLRIVAKPSEGERFFCKKSEKDLALLFAYRKVAFGWFPILSDLAPLNLQVKSCFLAGQRQTVYEANLDVASRGQSDHRGLVGRLKLC